MSVTYQQAYDELATAVIAAWAQAPQYINQQITIPMLLANKEPDVPYSPMQYYARFSMVDARSPQVTFATQNNAQDKRRFRTYGTAFVQLFSPQVSVTGEDDLKALATLAQSILRKSTPNVTLSNARVKLLNSDSNYYRRNVVADYNYDEIV